MRVENSGTMICAERSETLGGRLLATGDSRIICAVLPFMGLCSRLHIGERKMVRYSSHLRGYS